MKTSKFLYVFNHNERGLIQRTTYNHDQNLSVGNYVQVEMDGERRFHLIYKVDKILDYDKNVVIYILYIETVEADFDEFII